jgi:hypothetical protein
MKTQLGVLHQDNYIFLLLASNRKTFPKLKVILDMGITIYYVICNQVFYLYYVSLGPLITKQSSTEHAFILLSELQILNQCLIQI